MKSLIILILSLLCLVKPFFAQTPEELHAALPVVEKWTVSPDIEVFNRENLYERINGAAPLFLENNFQEMTSMQYTQGDDYITIQAYRHATPEDAFGMYASERSTDMTFYPGIGGEAQGDDYGLFFFSGSIYVKLWTSNIEIEDIVEVFKKIALNMAKKIDDAPDYPAIFSFFPKEGLIPYTQSYVTLNYIGHEFLKPVYTCNYNFNGSVMQLFVIDGKTPDNAKRILDEYFNFTKQPQDFTEGNLLIKDRYNGNIPAVWKGKYIIGAFHDSGDDFPGNIYTFLNKFNVNSDI
ncbi:MAG: hypothetical protein LBH32_13770 [Dysgonamonadaceae bacterium]|jgi:hypothetical protein|nr:hypothetical protein [Dysgonamonadaceae bacterium]